MNFEGCNSEVEELIMVEIVSLEKLIFFSSKICIGIKRKSELVEELKGSEVNLLKKKES